MKRTLALMLAVFCIITIFAGCAPQTEKNAETPDTQTEQPAPSTPDAEQPEQPSEDAHEPVTLSMWWPNSTGDAFDKLCEDWANLVHEKYDWITIEILSLPWADYDSKVAVAYAGGTMPDLLGVGYNPLSNYVASGYIMPLDEMLGTSWDGWTDIPENVLSYTRYEDSFYGAMLMDIRPFIWRKDMFEAAGLDPDTPPSSKEELMEYAKTLTQYDDQGKVTVAGFQISTTGYVDQSLYTFMLMNGIDSFWDENYDLTITDNRVVQAVYDAKAYIDEGLCDYSEGLVSNSFIEGYCAMSMSTSCLDFGSLASVIGFENIGVAPTFMDGKNFCGSTVLCVNSKLPEEKMEAVKLAYEVISGSEAQTLAGVSCGYCPSRDSALEKYVASNEAVYGPVAEMQKTSKTYGPLNPYFSDFRNSAIMDYMEMIYYGEIGVEEGLAEANEAYIQARADRDFAN